MLDNGFTTLGGSIGLNLGSNNSGLRAQSHEFVDDTLKLSDGKLYIRMLLSISKAAANKLASSSEITQKMVDIMPLVLLNQKTMITLC